MWHHINLNDFDVRSQIRKGRMAFGGNRKLKIYGRLDCNSGKRMKRENRVFFATEADAKKQQFRPCGHCMKTDYQKWKMDLFTHSSDENPNLLPKEGNVQYYGTIMPVAEANRFYQVLFDTIEWKNDEAVLFGKLIITKRKVAWYGDMAFQYTYSNTTKSALAWTPELLELKQIIEAKTGETFNSCLLNLYHSGEEGMAWHSDGEKDLKKNGAIASLSFGAERKFAFKHKQTAETVSLLLQHGSLLVMKDQTQAHWLHRLPPTKTVQKPRVNLTFRTIVENQLR